MLSPTTRKPISYSIEISEAQRVRLLEVLKLLTPRRGVGPCADGQALHGWLEMLNNLPDQEAKTPGVLYGFCYY